MPDEIFKNPTVKMVIFQIQYPNLFSIEKIIGDYQESILEIFPQSSLIFSKDIFFTVGSGSQVKPENENDVATKIWQFSTEKDVKMNIQTNSLDIVSTQHKTYSMGDGDKFRDLIQFSLDRFFKLVRIPIINRIGLRYIDHCPILKKDNETYMSYYDTCFPLTRFSLETADTMDFKVVTKRGEYILAYRESVLTKDNEFKLILDFDGSALKAKPEDYLSITDSLHKLIADEFKRTAKEPLKEYMRK